MDRLYEEKICELLDELKEKLLKFEQETIEIMNCDIDDIEGHSFNRVMITRELDKVFARIEVLCSEMDGGDRIRKMIKSSRDLTEVNEDEERIYLKAQEIFSLLNRIRDSDVQAVDRIDLEKAQLLSQIKAENNGVSAKAARFAVGTDDGRRKFVGYGGKKI